jgi:hypothetical protein
MKLQDVLFEMDPSYAARHRPPTKADIEKYHREKPSDEELLKISISDLERSIVDGIVVNGNQSNTLGTKSIGKLSERYNRGRVSKAEYDKLYEMAKSLTSPNKDFVKQFSKTFKLGQNSESQDIGHDKKIFDAIKSGKNVVSDYYNEWHSFPTSAFGRLGRKILDKEYEKHGYSVIKVIKFSQGSDFTVIVVEKG